MKWLIIAVIIFAQQPAKTPEAKGPTEGKGTQVSEQADSGQNQQPPSKKTPSSPANNQHPAAEIQCSAPKANDDTEIQGKIKTFTGLLVVVGFLQFFALIGQVVIYCRQAKIMARQAREARRSRVWMGRQWQQMVASGSQTDSLIKEAIKQATNTGIAAEAASKSADAFVRSERAWIQVTMSRPLRVLTVPGKPDALRAWVQPDIANVGRTPAKITKVVLVAHVIHKPIGPPEEMPPELPPEPVYGGGTNSIGFERDTILAQNNGITPLTLEIPGVEFVEVAKRKAALYVYGYVDYFDILDSPHQTRFCQLFWAPDTSGDPNEEGFTVAGNTPAAYTHCT